MSEKEFTPTSDERDKVQQLEKELAAAKFDATHKELFGKYDVTDPNEGEDTYQSYLDQRPQDGIVREGGKFLNTATGKYVSEDDYEASKVTTNEYDNQQFERSVESQGAYENLTLRQLATKLGESEAVEDETMAYDVLEVISVKLKSLAEKYGWSEETINTHYDKLMDIADDAKGAPRIDVEEKSDQSQEALEAIALDAEARLDALESARKDNSTEENEAWIKALEARLDAIEPALEDESLEEYEARIEALKAKIEALKTMVIVDKSKIDDGKLDLSGLDPDKGPVQSKEEKDAIEAADQEVLKNITESTENYARLTAKDRKSYLGRFAKQGFFGKLLNKIPGVRSVIESRNDKQSEEITHAINMYENDVKDFLDNFEAKLRSNPEKELTEDQIRGERVCARIDLDAKLEGRIVANRLEQSKKTGKKGAQFVDWWVKQDGFTGKFKKAAVVLGAGFVAGGLVATGVGVLGGAAALGAIGSTVAGGATGGGIANFITQRRAGGKVKEGGMTVAQRDSGMDHAAKKELLNEHGADSRVAVEYTETQTDKEMLRNRKRSKIAIGLGAAAGGGAFSLEQFVADKLNPADVAESTGGSTDVETPDKPSVEKPASSELLGDDFTVESGNGFTNEWMDWAETNGHDLNSHDAYSLHNAVRAEFGDSGIIDNLGTYVQGGDLRIANPGSTGWNSGVADFAQKWLAARGKW